MPSPGRAEIRMQRSPSDGVDELPADTLTSALCRIARRVMTMLQSQLVRTRYAVDDLLQAREWVALAYGAQLQIRSDAERSSQMTVDQVQAGAMNLVDVNVPFDVNFRVHGQGEYVFLIQRAGTAEIERGKDVSRFHGGDVFLAIRPQDELRSRNAYADLSTVSLPAWLLNQSVELNADTSAHPWEFTSSPPDPAGAGRWRRVVAFVRDTVAIGDEDASPLLVNAMARLLAATALVSFPNTAFDQKPAENNRDAHPDTLRRAIAFIESQPHLDITVADIARASFVSPRAVQLAFRHHLDTTPTAYLRRVRLSCARQQLLNATRGDGTTITRIAQEWGFTSSRFAQQYRAAYGELPSQTLRH